MKDYNQEYFYVRRKGINFPSIDYVNWPDSDLDYLTDVYDGEKVIPFKFGEPMPNNLRLADLHGCAYKMVCSEIIKKALEEMNLKGVQFIPATIRDHTDKVIEGYYIIHIYNLIECMNMDISKWRSPRRTPEIIQSIDKLVLDNEKLDVIPLEDRLVFALKEHPLTTLYHRSVIDKILSVTPTGVGVYCLADWDGSNPFEDEFWEYIMS